jgi:streptomycin 3"-adenylyltransferase
VIPGEIAAQLDRLVAGLREVCGERLVAIYLHGSLALGGFQPGRSDLDVLVVVREPQSDGARRALRELLLRVSADPAPVEISVVSQSELQTWRHPCPYDFHYSEDWRERAPAGRGVDPDLALHVALTRARGRALFGPPPREVLADARREHVLDSILRDVAESLPQIHAKPAYAVLNACRTLAWLRDGAFRSKEEGGLWALTALPPELTPAVQSALAAYRGHPEPAVSESLDRFADFARRELALRGAR